MIDNVCIFCLAHRDRGTACTYGMAHEYPAGPAPKQAPKRDTQRCTKCGLHPKNPASATNGCEHEYDPRTEVAPRTNGDSQ